MKHFLNGILFLCLYFSVNVVQPEANQTSSHNGKLKRKKKYIKTNTCWHMLVIKLLCRNMIPTFNTFKLWDFWGFGLCLWRCYSFCIVTFLVFLFFLQLGLMSSFYRKLLTPEQEGISPDFFFSIVIHWATKQSIHIYVTSFQGNNSINRNVRSKRWHSCQI